MSIELSDIVLMEQMIRACQQRGSFKPEEMVSVGTLYKKITDIIDRSLVKMNEPSGAIGIQGHLPTISE
jgi:hypothetical protein